MNLVCSSLKYTHSGTIKISASQTHSEAQVVVADTGAGIPPQQLQQALDPFELVSGWDRDFGGWGQQYRPRQRGSQPPPLQLQQMDELDFSRWVFGGGDLPIL